MVKCLTQEHNMLVTAGLEPATFGSRVEHGYRDNTNLQSWKKVLEHFGGPHCIIVTPLPRTMLSDTSVFCHLPGVSNID